MQDEHAFSKAPTFRAQGKLLLTGEYLVLEGAKALAVPTFKGQTLRVETTPEINVLHLVSFDHRGEIWIEYAFSRRELQDPEDSHPQSKQAATRELLKSFLKKHPLLWSHDHGLRLRFELEFDREWGLGSSSTFAYLLAAWVGDDPFEVNALRFGGSGYDIACAGAPGPVLYSLEGADGIPRYDLVAWHPAWLKNAYLVYLGQKRDSRAAIAAFDSLPQRDMSKFISDLDDITDALLIADETTEAVDLFRRHESLIGYVTHQRPIGRLRFGDFPGTVKSLGAWGGDFALALPSEDMDVAAYFAQHHLSTVLPATSMLQISDSPAPIQAAQAGDWPVFWYTSLTDTLLFPDPWLLAAPHCESELLEFAQDDRESWPYPSPGHSIKGLLAYLAPPHIARLDILPFGIGFSRRHARVRVGSWEITAQVWVKN